MIGRDGDEPWWAAARGSNGCWRVSFDRGEGAHLEGETMHFANGLVLPLAADFEPPTYPTDPFPLRVGDTLCLDDRGRVESVTIWIPY